MCEIDAAPKVMKLSHLAGQVCVRNRHQVLDCTLIKSVGTTAATAAAISSSPLPANMSTFLDKAVCLYDLALAISRSN